MSIPTPQEYDAIVKSRKSRLRQECSMLLTNYLTKEMSERLRRGAVGRLTLGFAAKPCPLVDKLFNDAVTKFASRGWLLKIDHDEWTGIAMALSNTESDPTYKIAPTYPPSDGHVVILTVEPLPTESTYSFICSKCHLVDYSRTIPSEPLCAMCVGKTKSWDGTL